MSNLQNKSIYTISYTTTERMIVKFEQKTERMTHYLNLTTEKITTTTHTFHLNDVLDVSYKPFSGIKGLLYLHTNQGVFMYEIESDPSDFIKLYKNYLSLDI